MDAFAFLTGIYPIYTSLFQFLTAADMIRLSKTNKRLRNLLDGYFRRAYDIDAQLIHFFPDPESFRELQFHTGAVISGSFAFQFFTRGTLTQIDLDVFVGSGSQEEVGGWLLRHGFSYSPARIFRGGIEETQYPYSYAIQCPGFREVYIIRVMDILDFVRVVDGVERRVALYVTFFSPIETIIRFPFSEFSSLFVNVSAVGIISMSPELHHIRSGVLFVPCGNTRKREGSSSP